MYLPILCSVTFEASLHCLAPQELTDSLTFRCARGGNVSIKKHINADLR